MAEKLHEAHRIEDPSGEQIGVSLDCGLNRSPLAQLPDECDDVLHHLIVIHRVDSLPISSCWRIRWNDSSASEKQTGRTEPFPSELSALGEGGDLPGQLARTLESQAAIHQGAIHARERELPVGDE